MLGNEYFMFKEELEKQEVTKSNIKKNAKKK